MGNEESKRVLSEVIRRQMAILGPDITLAKVKNVPGIEIDAAGNVINVTGDTQKVLQELINQFVELSGLIVKKTMESIIMSSANGAQIAAQQLGVAVPTPAAPAQQTPISAQPLSQTPASTPTLTQAPEGYAIGAQQAPAPEQAQTQAEKENIASANREIEDLNKMLGNLTFTTPSSGGPN